MTAQETYLAVLTELNQYEAPEFDYEDFNYWIRKAENSVYANYIEEYEENQIAADLISPALKVDTVQFNVDETTDNRSVDLPADYKHLARATHFFVYKQDSEIFKQNDTRRVAGQPVAGSTLSRIEKNYYTRPKLNDAEERVYHRVVNKKLSVHFDAPETPNNEVYLSRAEIEYFIELPGIEIDENGSSVRDSIFNSDFQDEVVSKTVVLFLEHSQRQRFQTKQMISKS